MAASIAQVNNALKVDWIAVALVSGGF